MKRATPERRPHACQQLGCDAPAGHVIRYRLPGPGWGYPDRANEAWGTYGPEERVELERVGGRWLCGSCRRKQAAHVEAAGKAMGGQS